SLVQSSLWRWLRRREAERERGKS
ncbi:hypothetical protein CCACVL1_08929, partial [Corchorus capsularis]